MNHERKMFSTATVNDDLLGAIRVSLSTEIMATSMSYFLLDAGSIIVLLKPHHRLRTVSFDYSTDFL